jgi:hypothetical protein
MANTGLSKKWEKPWWLLNLLVENAHQLKGVFGKTSPPDLLKKSL